MFLYVYIIYIYIYNKHNIYNIYIYIFIHYKYVYPPAPACQGHPAAKGRSFLCPTVPFLVQFSLSNSPGALGSLPTCLFPPSWFLPPTAQDQSKSRCGAYSQDPGGLLQVPRGIQEWPRVCQVIFSSAPRVSKSAPRGFQEGSQQASCA